MPELHEPDPAARSARARPRSSRSAPSRSAPTQSGQFDDELVGLDPEDPDAQAFAAHLDRMQRQPAAFTVEGYLEGVSHFADSANRAEGGRRWAAVLIVLLLLAVAAHIVWDALMFVVLTWL